MIALQFLLPSSSKYIRPLKSTQNLYSLRIQEAIRQWFAVLRVLKKEECLKIIIIFMLKQYFNLGAGLTRVVQFRFSGTFFSKIDKPKIPDPKVIDTPKEDHKPNTTKPLESGKKFFKLSEQKQKNTPAQSDSVFESNSNASDAKGLEDLVNKINDANKYFLGVKLNTNYLKVNKIVKYEEVATMTSDKVTSSDIPLELSKKPTSDWSQIFDKADQTAALNQKSAQIAFSRSRLEPTIHRMESLIRQYILNLTKKQRLVGLEPNFEMQCIKTMNSLSPKITFKITNEEAIPEIKIKSVTLLKGLAVHRNENYSTDSFEKSEQEAADGIVSYKLYRQLKEQYPEVEWFSTKKINARFQILVKGGPTVEILDSGASLGSSEQVVHSVIIETDLVPPPPIAEHQLTPEAYLRSYRLDYNSLIITNFDRKNSFYPLTYTQNEKKTILINRIE